MLQHSDEQGDWRRIPWVSPDCITQYEREYFNTATIQYMNIQCNEAYTYMRCIAKDVAEDMMRRSNMYTAFSSERHSSQSLKGEG